VSLAATVAATVVAAILAALIARRDALIAIPVSFGLWAIIGISVVAVGAHLRHTGLTDWGWILVTASGIGAAADMPLAAHRGPPRQHRGRAAAAARHPEHAQPARPMSGQVHTRAWRR
jgi:hypothetical protein